MAGCQRPFAPTSAGVPVTVDAASEAVVAASGRHGGAPGGNATAGAGWGVAVAASGDECDGRYGQHGKAFRGGRQLQRTLSIGQRGVKLLHLSFATPASGSEHLRGDRDKRAAGAVGKARSRTARLGSRPHMGPSHQGVAESAEHGGHGKAAPALDLS